MPESTPEDVVEGYLRALNRAEKVLQADLPKYLPLWSHSVPVEFQAQEWNFAGFSRGERFIYEPFPKNDFAKIFSQVERWDLAQYVKETGYQDLIYTPPG